jgi:hypothetical protein
MNEVKGGHSETITLAAGYTLTIASQSLYASGIVRRIGPNLETFPGNQITNIPANTSKSFGPFPRDREYSIEAAGTGYALSYDIERAPFDNATQIGNIEGFTGSFTLKNEDMGKVFRCDDASPSSITVPNDLIQGFNCGFIQGNSGSVTIVAGTGAVNHGGKSALSTQYQVGSLIVFNVNAEFLLGGDFA